MACSTKFEKRPGTTDLGKDFESAIVAQLALQHALDKKSNRFLISSNHKDFGSFDDIVLELSTDRKEVKYALQLKYVINTGKHSLLNKLLGENGKLSIREYFSNYKTLGQSVASYILILFTNMKFDVPDGGKIRRFLPEFDIKITKSQSSCDISSKGKCFKFEVVNVKTSDSALIESYQEFFKHFFLYTDQPSIADVEECVLTTFKEKLSCETHDIGGRYLNFVNQWSKREGRKNKLSKELVQEVIALLMLAPFAKPLSFTGDITDEAKLLRMIVSEFEVVLIGKNCYDKIDKLWGNDSSLLEDLSNVNRMAVEHQISIKPIRNIPELSNLDKNKILWLMNTHPLVVTGNDTTCKALNLCHKKKFVVCVDQLIGDALQNTSVFRNLSDLPEESPIYHDLLKTLRLTFQGKDLSLQSFIGNNNEMKRMITMDELMQMVEHVFTIGGQQELLPEAHVDRNLTRNTISCDFLSKAPEDTLVIISCVERLDKAEKELKSMLQHIIIHSLDENNCPEEISQPSELDCSDQCKSRFHIKMTECSFDEFIEICQDIESKTNYQHLKLTEDGKLEWIHGTGQIAILEEFRETSNVGTPESELLNFKNCNNIEVICGEPGIGKTTLVKNLRNKYSDAFWKIIIYPKVHVKFLQNINQNEDFAGQFMQHIVDKTCQNNFESDLLTFMTRILSVVFFWDGLDEISDNLLEVVTEIIKQLSERGYRQILTTRSHLAKTLETKFGVLSKTIKRFDDAEQKSYIQNRLQCPKHLMEPLLVKITSYIKLVRYNDILGIPLQISMLVELFNQNPEKYTDPSAKIFSVVDLYRYTIDEKLNIYLRKINHDNKETSETLKEYLLCDYQRAALKVLLDKKHLQLLHINCDKFLEKLKRNSYCHGIITSITQDGVISFLHLSYAEFLAASYFYENYKTIRCMEDIMFDDRLNNVRFMFDLLMAEESPVHLAVLYRNLEMLESNRDQMRSCKDRGGRNPLQVGCTWGQRYPLPSKINDQNRVFFLPNWSVRFDVRELSEYEDLVSLLSEECDPLQRDELYGFDSFSYADKAHCLLPIVILAKRYPVEFDRLHYFDIYAVLFYCVLDNRNYDSLLEAVEENDFIRLDYGNMAECQFHWYKSEKSDESKELKMKNSVATPDNGWISVWIKTYTADFEIAELFLAEKVIKHQYLEFETTTINGYIIQNHSEHNNTTVRQKMCMCIDCFYNDCALGNIGSLRTFLKLKFDINMIDQMGRTAIWVASQYAQADIVRLLLKEGASTEIADKLGKTPLYIACQCGNREIANLLIQQGASTKILDKIGRTALFVASQKGHHDVVRLLLERETLIDYINTADERLWSPIYVASKHGHFEVVKTLLQNNADPNKGDGNRGRSPLYIAAKNGHSEVVELLIKHGADINAMVKGQSPLYVATARGHFNIVKLLCKHNAKIQNSVYDRKNIDLPALIVRLFLKHEPLCLHHAITNGLPNLLALLLERKAIDVNKSQENHWTPMHEACRVGSIECFDVLRKYQASIDLPDSFGWTPLRVACQHGHDILVEKLLKAYANADMPDNFGWTPIQVACRKGDCRLLELLVDNETNVNCCDALGKTPLYTASEEGHADIVQLLLEHKAVVYVMDKDGNTPLHIACAKGHDEVVSHLLTCPADARASLKNKNKDGMTPLDLARQGNYLEIVRLLRLLS